MRKKQYKKMKKQLNNNLSSLIRTSVYPQTTQPSSPSWKRPIYLKFFVFFNVGHFLVLWITFSFRSRHAKQLNSKEQTWKLKIHSIMSQFTTLNVRAIDIERARQRHHLRSFQHLFTYAPHNRTSPVTTPK